MDRKEYVKELRKLYDIAVQQKDVSVALHLLQRIQSVELNKKAEVLPEKKAVTYSVGSVWLDSYKREWLLMSCKDKHVMLLNIKGGFVFWSGEHRVENIHAITSIELCNVMNVTEFTLKGTK